MSDKPEDKVSLSMEARVAEIFNSLWIDYQSGKINWGELMSYLPQKIIAMVDGWEVDGWVFTVKCRQRTEACTFFGAQPLTCPDGFSTRICSKTSSAKQHEVNSGSATRKG